MINILFGSEKSRWLAEFQRKELVSRVISIWHQNSVSFSITSPSSLCSPLPFSSSFSSLFSPPPLLKAKWWIWTSWHCLNSLTHLVQQDIEHCLARLKCFPSTLLLETMEVLWLTSCKQYLSQAYGHVLLWILPSGAVLVLCKEQELIGRGSTLYSSLKRTKGIIQSFYLHA